ncbi:MAG: molybdenum cofactor biosynthesis protein MoaE [Acinetobacter sp.]
MPTKIQNHQDFARIQTTALQLDAVMPIAEYPMCGGIGVFVGTVRNHHNGKAVKSLKYTAYAPVAEKMIRQIEQEIAAQYQVDYVRVVHRVGHLDIGEKAIIAVAFAAHRREAFAACEHAVERVKHEVPVYKEEFYQDGTHQHVEGCCIRRDIAQEQSKDEGAHTHQHFHSSHS